MEDVERRVALVVVTLQCGHYREPTVAAEQHAALTDVILLALVGH